MRCPKCGFDMNQDLFGLRKLELETMLGDLVGLDKFKKTRKHDGTHYYEGMNSGTKEVIVEMIKKVNELRRKYGKKT